MKVAALQDPRRLHQPSQNRWFVDRSGRVEFFDQPEEGSFKCRLVPIGVSAVEIDNLSVVVRGLLMIAARLAYA